METALANKIHVYNSYYNTAKTFALEELIQPLSKAVLERGRELKDERSLLELSYWRKGQGFMGQRETTEEFRLFTEFNGRMTVAAQCQITKINNAMYPFPEIISMMLEQGDYWEIDLPIIIEMAIAYLEGRFDHKDD